MTKSFLTTAALVIAGSIAANAAWEPWDGSQMQNTDTVTYSYQNNGTTNPITGNFAYYYIGSTGASNEVIRELPGTIDFRQDARYEITFRMDHYDYSSGDYPASGTLCFVNSNNDVSLMFGNSRDAMGRLGCILGQDVTNSQGQQNLVNTSTGGNFWTAQKGTAMSYGNGNYQYRIIFETFSDSSIADKIYFEVKNIDTQTVSYFNIKSTDLGCGAPNDQVFDDLDFVLIGAQRSGTGNTTTNGNPGVDLVGKANGVHTVSFTSYTRTETVIPEPSAFGLLAGIGALALVASRRRRK